MFLNVWPHKGICLFAAVVQCVGVHLSLIVDAHCKMPFVHSDGRRRWLLLSFLRRRCCIIRRQRKKTCQSKQKVDKATEIKPADLDATEENNNKVVQVSTKQGFFATDDDWSFSLWVMGDWSWFPIEVTLLQRFIAVHMHTTSWQRRRGVVITDCYWWTGRWRGLCLCAIGCLSVVGSRCF